MFVELPVKVLGQDAHVGEQRSEHVELLAKQLYPLLQPLVLFNQQLDLLLGFAAADLRLFPALANRYVVPLAPPLVLVRVLVHRLVAAGTRLPVVVVVMGLQMR